MTQRAFSGMVLDPNYSILEQWQKKEASIRVVCAGAGPAGILEAYKCKKELKNAEFKCYEK